MKTERPNCPYETGFAQAFGKRILFIMKRGVAPPFDLGHYYFREFTQTKEVFGLLKHAIPGFLRSPKRRSWDDLNWQFGRNCFSDGYTLSGRIKEKVGKRAYSVDLQVYAQLTGLVLDKPVRFHIHNTFNRSRQMVQPKHGIAQLTEWNMEGPSKVGAEILGTETKLELDLTYLPGGD